MEFASLCIDNFSVVIYILELVYNLRRNNLILSGCIPHLNVKTNIGSKHSVKKKKIGRNAPCYCGSGKNIKMLFEFVNQKNQQGMPCWFFSISNLW